jgi:hypothetical protein
LFLRIARKSVVVLKPSGPTTVCPNENENDPQQWKDNALGIGTEGPKN